MPISAQHTKFEYPDYISPLPADELLKFAQKKQEMYDEGVAKIQQNIDSYHNLRSSILTDVEKEYFDKSMGNLVKAISSSAGLDFSNKANVQAVLSVGKPLERDQYIITAISNGKEVARRQEQLSKMKPGERSAVNDYFYMKDVNDYMQSGKLGQKIGYGKEYIPYVDLSKDWMEFMKTQKPNQSESFTSESGMGPAYIEKVTVEGFNTAELAEKFKAFIATDPNKLRQFQMDAGYSLDQIGKEGAYEGYVEDMQAKATTAGQNAQMFKAEADRLGKAYATTKSATVKAQYEQAKQKATYYEQSRLLAEQKASTTLEDFDLGEYMEIYQDKFATNMGNMYATQKVSRDLISNEYWKEARADSRMMLKAQLDRKTAIDVNNLNQKIGFQVDTSVIKPLLQNAKGIQNAISYMGEMAKASGDGGTATNMKNVTQDLALAFNNTGAKQLFYIEQAISRLQDTKIPFKYKQALVDLFTEGRNDIDFVTLRARMMKDLNSIRTKISAVKGDDAYLPAGTGGNLSQTLGGMNSFNFVDNAKHLDGFYVGAPDVSVSAKDDATGITKTTKYSSDIDKK